MFNLKNANLLCAWGKTFVQWLAKLWFLSQKSPFQPWALLSKRTKQESNKKIFFLFFFFLGGGTSRLYMWTKLLKGKPILRLNSELEPFDCSHLTSEQCTNDNLTFEKSRSAFWKKIKKNSTVLNTSALTSS